MADENEAEPAEAGEEKKGGGGAAIKALILPIAASAITAAIVGAIFTFVLAPKPQVVTDEVDKALEESAHTEQQAVVQETGESGVKTTGIFHNYDPFIVSIFDREKVHYLKVVLSLELESEGVKDTIAAKNPQIRDAMIFVLSDFTLRELLDNQAKNLLKEVMTKTLNKILGKGKIVNIFFTEFTIQ